MNRNVKTCTAENPWFSSTFVLTKLVPQNATVPMASRCQSAMLLRVGVIAGKDRKVMLAYFLYNRLEVRLDLFNDLFESHLHQGVFLFYESAPPLYTLRVRGE